MYANFAIWIRRLRINQQKYSVPWFHGESCANEII